VLCAGCNVRWAGECDHGKSLRQFTQPCHPKLDLPHHNNFMTNPRRSVGVECRLSKLEGGRGASAIGFLPTKIVSSKRWESLPLLHAIRQTTHFTIFYQLSIFRHEHMMKLHFSALDVT